MEEIMERIKIRVTDEGIVELKNVPAGVEIEVEDEQEGTFALFGEGDNNILSQKM
jgi:hypothetical protein